MQTITFKKTFTAVMTAATLLTSGMVTVNQAQAETVFINPGLIKKIKPGPQVLLPGKGGNICITKPWLCKPGGIKTPPKKPSKPKGGLTDGQKVGLGILGALAVGAVVANSRNQAADPGPYNNHLAWCSGKYKSFRASDNTFQPYKGGRRACISPYLR